MHPFMMLDDNMVMSSFKSEFIAAAATGPVHQLRDRAQGCSVQSVIAVIQAVTAVIQTVNIFIAAAATGPVHQLRYRAQGRSVQAGEVALPCQ